MPNRRRVGMVLAAALPALLVTAGCEPTTDSDPNSPEFAALCAGALGDYYVEGGKAPEFDANAKRQRYWIKRYYSLTGMGEEAAKKIVKIGFDLAYEHRKESPEDQNKSMKKIMDACAPHEV